MPKTRHLSPSLHQLFSTRTRHGTTLGICLLALTTTGILQAADSKTSQSSNIASKIDALRNAAAQKGWTFEVNDNPAMQYELHELTGVVIPENWRKDAPFDEGNAPRFNELPTTFDWRNVGGVNYCTNIRNQAGCGSCWAFALLGSVESCIKIKDNQTVDLSEQWLVSCCGLGGCSGEWPGYAANYLLSSGSYLDNCGDSGAVLESDSPYQASDTSCACPYDHPYAMDGWSFIGPEWGIPSTEQLKQAILDHGPITVCVRVTGSFQAYSGGIYNDSVDEAINHAVVLVGWDDSQGTDGVWFMRNSWGSWWGEAGYMRIEYGCSRIGYNGLYVDYQGNGDNDGVLHVPSEYASIQDAIDAAMPGEEVLVGPGQYTNVGENVIRLMGKPIRVSSSHGPEETILDGELGRPVIELIDEESTATVIEGFTITRGYSMIGGGLRINGTPTIKNCIVRDNVAQSLAGGMMCAHPIGPMVENVHFCHNMVGTATNAHMFGNLQNGGGIFLDDWCECPGDTNGDTFINVNDVLAVIAAWGTDDPGADQNLDGTVNVNDLLFVISHWGLCP